MRGKEETTQFSIRLPVEMKDSIKRLADLQRRSLSNQILCLLTNALLAESKSEQASVSRHQQEIESCL